MALLPSFVAASACQEGQGQEKAGRSKGLVWWEKVLPACVSFIIAVYGKTRVLTLHLIW